MLIFFAKGLWIPYASELIEEESLTGDLITLVELLSDWNIAS